MSQPNPICTTPAGCACSPTGEECCCFPNDGLTECRACGAPIVLIDLETGEELTS